MTPKKIISAVSRVTGVPIHFIKENLRTESVAEARHLCCYFLSKTMTVNEIALILNHKKSAVHAGKMKISGLLDVKDKTTVEKCNKIKIIIL